MKHAQPIPLALSALQSALVDFNPERAGSDVTVTGLSQDSRQVTPGCLFAVRQGTKQSGEAYVEQACAAGASALLIERATAAEEKAQRLGVPYLAVSDVAAVLGPAAQVLFGLPSSQLAVVGVTGTNGKTTTVTLLRQALGALGHAAAELGTLGFVCGDLHYASGLTTPGPELIARDMRTAAAAGAGFFVMEVSSHAVVQRRIDGILFRVVAFSNLTRYLLDFHGSEAEYAAAKFRLFTDYPAARRVVNVDDAQGAQFARELVGVGQGVLSVSRKGAADVSLVSATARGRLTELVVNVKGETFTFPTELVGDHNIDNLLLSFGILIALGIAAERLPEAASHMTGAAGRLERCDSNGDDIIALVDYAHTPDALERVLRACRGLTAGRVLLVFGCGGDRDPGKRAPMGEIAAQGADACWVTNDNPRSEDPERIARAIVEGVRAARGTYEVCLDRQAAIARAVAVAQPGDVVLIAGKGHEDYQLIGPNRFDFDDRIAARVALAARRALQDKANQAAQP